MMMGIEEINFGIILSKNILKNRRKTVKKKIVYNARK